LFLSRFFFPFSFILYLALSLFPYVSYSLALFIFFILCFTILVPFSFVSYTFHLSFFSVVFP